jgi:hypothetical protein
MEQDESLDRGAVDIIEPLARNAGDTTVMLGPV